MKKVTSLILTLAMLLSMLTFGSTVTAAEVDNTVYTEVDTLAEFTTALANKQNIVCHIIQFRSNCRRDGAFFPRSSAGL